MCYIVVPPAEDGEDCLILISVCTMLECLLSAGALQGISFLFALETFCFILGVLPLAMSKLLH